MAKKPKQILELEEYYGFEINYFKVQNEEVIFIGIYGKQISDLKPIASLNNLSSLNLLYNQISDLKPLASLGNLTSLILSHNQISDLKPISSLGNLTSLDIYGNQISDLKPLASLGNLKSLDISYNHISDINPIASLIKLTSLDLSSNDISDLKPIASLRNLLSLNLSQSQNSDLKPIASLGNLTSLDISYNQISDIKPIASLIKLTSLDLSYNLISNLNPIAFLGNLTSLNLTYNQISDLKPLAALGNLISLNLSDNQISDLKPISSLRNLILLNLSYNQISDLKPIASLGDLTSLNLLYNQISDLKSLNSLGNLTSINLSYNQISDLKPLASLYNLTSLDIYGNQISDLKPLASLGNIKSINLSQNQISDLRPLNKLIRFGLEVKVLDYDNEEGIYIKHNPIEIPPLEIIEQGNVAILAYLDSIEDQDKIEYLNEIRVIIIGKGKIGKTTLKKRLLGLEIPNIEDQTDGIKIDIWQPQELNGIKLRMWDFGGQEIQHTVHRLFLEENCIYLLVLDKRQDQQKSQDIIYWMDHIRSFGGTSPILVVENCIDTAIGSNPEMSNALINDTFHLDAEVEELYQKKDCKLEYVAVSAYYDINIKSLKQKLFALIKEENTKSPYNKNWLLSKDAVEASITGGVDRKGLANTNYITKETFDLTCEKNNVIKVEDKKTLLGVITRLGIAFHFERQNKSWLILNPEWATVAMYSIILNPKIKQLNGRLTKEDIFSYVLSEEKQSIFSKKNYKYNEEEISYILSLMRDYELCFTTDDNEYLFPLGFSTSYKSSFKEECKDHLEFIVNYESLPKSIWYKLITRLFKRNIVNKHWEKGIEVSLDVTRGLIELHELKDKCLKIFTENNQKGKLLLTLIRYEVDFLNKEFSNIEIHEELKDLNRSVVYEDLLESLVKNRGYDKGANKPIIDPKSFLKKYEDEEFTARNLVIGYGINDLEIHNFGKIRAEIDELRKSNIDIITMLAEQLKKGGSINLIQNINQNYNRNENTNINDRLELPHEIYAFEGKLNFLIEKIEAKNGEDDLLKEILQNIEELRKIPVKEQAIKKGYVDRFKSFVDRFKSPSDLIRAIETYKEYGTIDVSGIKEYLELILRIFDLK